MREVKVGTVVKLKLNMMNNKPGTLGVCYEKYNIGDREGQSFIFKNGNYDGFSDDEVWKYLDRVGFCRSVSDFVFLNVTALSKVFNAGYFEPVFSNDEMYFS